MLSACIPVRGYRGGAEMSRRIYSPLSLIAVSWLDKSTLLSDYIALISHSVLDYGPVSRTQLEFPVKIVEER